MTENAEATRSAAPTEAWLSVIVPVFENESTIAELHRRVCASVGERLCQMVFVDDASPDGSREAIDAAAETDRRVERLSLARNCGQHRAVLHGMDRARGRWTVVMDADLQDPPEAIPALIERAGASGADVVFAGRRGSYESPLRLLTSRLFKRLLARGCGVPPDAGMFFVCNRSAIERVTALAGPPPFVVAMIGRAGLRIDSVPVNRSRRPSGPSSYGSAMRLGSAARGLMWSFRRRTGALAAPEVKLDPPREETAVADSLPGP